MRVLITGACGFAGCSVAEWLLARREGLTVYGLDNLQRAGSEYNRQRLRAMGAGYIHGDIRAASDFENLPAVDWVIDAAANASVLAGVQGNGSSRQLFEHNLASLVNVLEYCKAHKAGLLLLSTSRVYSIPALVSLPLRTDGRHFTPSSSVRTCPAPGGLSREGDRSGFSTAAADFVYGSTKLASEAIAS